MNKLNERLLELHKNREKVTSFSDREVQELEHDFLCEVWYDITMTNYSSEMYEVFKAERIARNLEELPRLFGEKNN